MTDNDYFWQVVFIDNVHGSENVRLPKDESTSTLLT